MTTLTPTALAKLLEADGQQLVADIERYLAQQSPTTAHPLVTKTTNQLVAEALAALNQQQHAPTASQVRLPGGLWRILPDWSLTLLRPLHGGTRSVRRGISVAEHLALTALVLEKWGWEQTGNRWRTRGGKRCILGAQAVLYRLGYGDERTVEAAAAHLHAVLAGRGIRQNYWVWNDERHVGPKQVLDLVNSAHQRARAAGQ